MLLVLMFILVFLIACNGEKEVKTIKEVRYTNSSGSILPELQWSEEYSLSIGNSVLIRKGRVENTQVNAGLWALTVDEQSLQQLFDSLKELDCTKLQRIEPVEPPDGGGTEEFTIVYENGNTCNMFYNPGVSYENGDEFAISIRKFINGIVLPDSSVDRHQIP